MTTLEFDLQEVGMHPTSDGMAFSKEGDLEVTLVDLRIVIEAPSRDSWWVSEVGMIHTEYLGGKMTEKPVELKGAFLAAAIDFLHRHKDRDLQDRVDEELEDQERAA